MNYEVIVDDDDSHIIWNKSWLNPKTAVEYYNKLKDDIPWIQTYGTYTFSIKNTNEVETKTIPVPRLV